MKRMTKSKERINQSSNKKRQHSHQSTTTRNRRAEWSSTCAPARPSAPTGIGMTPPPCPHARTAPLQRKLSLSLSAPLMVKVTRPRATSDHAHEYVHLPKEYPGSFETPFDDRAPSCRARCPGQLVAISSDRAPRAHSPMSIVQARSYLSRTSVPTCPPARFAKQQGSLAHPLPLPRPLCLPITPPTSPTPAPPRATRMKVECRGDEHLRWTYPDPVSNPAERSGFVITWAMTGGLN